MVLNVQDPTADQTTISCHRNVSPRDLQRNNEIVRLVTDLGGLVDLKPLVEKVMGTLKVKKTAARRHIDGLCTKTGPLYTWPSGSRNQLRISTKPDPQKSLTDDLNLKESAS